MDNAYAGPVGSARVCAVSIFDSRPPAGWPSVETDGGGVPVLVDDGVHAATPARRAAVVRSGVTPGRSRGPEWWRPFRDTYVPASAHGRAEALLRAALFASGADSVLSHQSAAVLWRLPLPLGGSGLGPVHTTVPVRRPRRNRPGLRVHTCSLTAAEVRVVGGLRVTAPARTWLDLAAQLPVVDLVALTDTLLHRRLTTLNLLLASVAGGAGRRGIRAARDALSRADGRAESAWESRLRLVLLDAGLPVVPQVIVLSRTRRFVARVDLGLVRWRIAVEFDGAHHLATAQQRADMRRINALHRVGWVVLRYTAAQVLGDPAGIVEEVRATMVARS